ncbi:MAG: DNA-processing protein DprA [Clostridia bacterium]|nr:DNA-processing protein DprA [Clostridia bacterium]
MQHTDDAYTLMLLTLPMSPDADEAVKPLTGEEMAYVMSRPELAFSHRPSLLMNRDLPGTMRMLESDEAFAYRVRILMSRDVLLSRLIDECIDSGIEILTPADEVYPRSLRQRLGDYSAPTLFAKGNAWLLKSDYLGLIALPGIKTPDSVKRNVRNLSHLAAENGMGIVTGGELGAGMLARRAALDCDARLVCCVTGGLAGFCAQKEHVEPIDFGNMLVLSSAHPLSVPDDRLIFERNRLIYALSNAAFVATTDGRQGEAEAAKRRLCDYLYYFEDPALPANSLLSSRGFTPVSDIEALDVYSKSEIWKNADAEQLRLF